MECIEDKLNGLNDWDLLNIEFGEHRMPASTVEEFLRSKYPFINNITMMNQITYNHSRELLDKQDLLKLTLAEQSDHLWLYYIIPKHNCDQILFHIINYNVITAS